MTIVGEKLNSANIKVKNTGDITYDIEANITVNGNLIGSFDSGTVTRISDKAQVATFNSYDMGAMAGSSNLTITHTNTNAEEQCIVTNKINEFQTAVKNTDPATLFSL